MQQDAFKQPGETPCKGWENCLRIAMGHKRRRCINANWMGQSGNNVQSATNRVCLSMYEGFHRYGIQRSFYTKEIRPQKKG